MTAITSNRQIKLEATQWQDFNVSTNTVYAGTLVCVNSSGILVDGTDIAGLEFVGVCKEQKDANNFSRVYKSGIFSFEQSGLAQADIGKDVWLADNQTVTNYAGSTNKIHVGKLVGLESNQAQILINSKAQNSQTFIANPTGTATSPTGGSTVDSQARTEINNLITDRDTLITKINAMLDILEQHGLMKVV